MKYSLLFGIVCFVVLANAERVDKFIETRKKCKSECGLPEDGRLDTDSETYIEISKVKKCYIKCFLEDVKIYKGGEIDEAHSLELIDEDQREMGKPLVKMCIEAGEAITDSHDKLYAMVKCFLDASPELFKLLGVFEPPRED